MLTLHLPWKFHANRSTRFLVMFLTKKQRKKERKKERKKCGLHWGPSCVSLVAIQPFACEKKRFSWNHKYGKMEKFWFSKILKFNISKNIWSIFTIFYPHLSLAVAIQSRCYCRIILQYRDLAKPMTQNFGQISSLTWRSRSRSPKNGSPTWRRMRRVHS